MTEQARCDKCVDSIFPPADCRDCAIEQQIADTEVPDFGPIVISRVEVEVEGAALANAWKRCAHPSEVAATLRAVVARSGPFYATLVARLALDDYGSWVIYQCAIDEQRTRNQRILPVLRILREIALADPSIVNPIPPRSSTT